MRSLILFSLLLFPLFGNSAIIIRRFLSFHDFKDKQNPDYSYVERTVTPTNDGTLVDIKCSGNGHMSCPKNIVHQDAENFSDYPQDIILFAQTQFTNYSNIIELNEGAVLPNQTYSVLGSNNLIYSILLISEQNAQGDVIVTMIIS
jgi:hypothetical protein